MEFNKQQKRIYSKIQKFSRSKNGRYKILIMGPSGSGKTTVVIKSLIDNADRSFGDLNVCFCAFTNKATKVLKDMVGSLRKAQNPSLNLDRFEFITIHSMLKLEPNTVDLSGVKKKSKSYETFIRRLEASRYENIYSWDSLKLLLNIDTKYNSKNQSCTNQSCIDQDQSRVSPDQSQDDLLLFSYDYKKLENIKKYDIIVIDECSTVSRELYVYIESTLIYARYELNHIIKVIFIGDYYQLPPVREYKSIVFELAIKNRWPVYKLIKVVRSKTNQIDKVNKKFLDFINTKIKSKTLKISDIEDPYKILKYSLFKNQPYDNIYINSQLLFFKKYVNLLTEDKIIITYSNGNCDKTNLSIQKLIDNKIGLSRDPDAKHASAYKNTPIMIWFKKGDRIMVQSPIEVPNYTVVKMLHTIIKPEKNSENENALQYENVHCISEFKKKNKVYNGDIYLVLKQEKIKVRSVLNSLDSLFKKSNSHTIPSAFTGQLLTLISAENYNKYDYKKTLELSIQLIHVDTLEVEKTRRLIKKILCYDLYSNYINLFRKNFTVFKRGYCVTCYKIQGGEFKHVFVNLKSFWACLSTDKKNNYKAKLLFSAFYTAATRSSSRLYLYW